MKVRIVILILVTFSCINVSAQDVRFSQFNATPLQINPGLAGMGNGYNRANLNYRSQWSSIQNSYSTVSASIDLPIFSEKMRWKKGYLGLGTSFYSDKAGDGKLGTTEADFVISSALFVGAKSKIALGIMGSYIQKSVNPDNIKWDQQYNGYEYDSSLPSGENFASISTSAMDMSAGLSYRYFTGSKAVTNSDQKLVEFGLATFKLFEPKFDFYLNGESKASRRFVAHGRFLSSIAGTPIVLGGTFLAMKQNVSQEITLGPEIRISLLTDTKYTGYIKDSYIGMQILYRNQDAIIPVLFYKFGNFKVAGSYDYNISQLNEASKGNGGFEISIQFNDFEGQLFKQGSKHVTMRGSAGNL